MWNWEASAGGSDSSWKLFIKAHDKSLKKSEREGADRALKFRIKFMAGLDAVGGAANSSGLGSDQQSQVKAAHDSYGTENDNNGVTVGIKVNGDPAGTRLNDDGTISAQFRDDDSDSKDSKSFAANIAHEGQHVEDAQAFLDSPIAYSPWDLTHYEREVRAYNTGSFAAQALGLKSYPAHSDSKAWQRGWGEVDRAKGIASYIRAGYGATNPGPEQPGKRYSEEYGGPVKWVP